jgi:hypothetical protein
MVFIAGSLTLGSGDEVGLQPLDLFLARAVAYLFTGTMKFLRLAERFHAKAQRLRKAAKKSS